MNIIVAVNRAMAIGNNGNLLFHIPDDMRYFAAKTTGKVVVMGRKTLESLPGGRPLPNRTNIVLSRTMSAPIPGIEVVRSVQELSAMAAAKGYKDEDIFIIGGGEIYRSFIDIADTLYVTEIEDDSAGDTYFPNIDNAKWVKTEGEVRTYKERTYRFNVYSRR